MIERILEIKNSSLVVSNLPLIDKKESCLLTADSAVGASTLTVDSITNISVGQYAILGNLGDADTEIVRVKTDTAPTGHTITLNAVTVFAHTAGTSFTIVDYNQVEFSVSTTLAGAKTILNTLTAVDIQPDSEETIYDAVADSVYIASTTVYVWMRFKNSAATTYSDYSATLLKAPASRTYDSLRTIGDKAMRACKERVGITVTYDDYLDWSESFIQELYAYKTSWRLFREIDSSLTTTSGTNYIDLSSDNQSIDSITFGTNNEVLKKVQSAQQWTTLNLASMSGEPVYYYLVKKRCYLYPTPNATYTLYVTQFYQPTRITSIDSAIDITRNGLFLMENYFRYRIYDKIGNRDAKSKEYANKFYALLESVAGQDVQDTVGEVNEIEVTKFYLYDDDVDNDLSYSS